jgi:hypothetical protein
MKGEREREGRRNAGRFDRLNPSGGEGMRGSNIVPREIQSITMIVLAQDTDGIKKVFPPRILAFKDRRSLRRQPDRGIGKEKISNDDVIAIHFALQISDPMSGLYSLQSTRFDEMSIRSDDK